jgi:hypothetical protein
MILHRDLSLVLVVDRGLVTSSVIARNRTELRRSPVGEVDKYLVDIAPSPSFRRIVAFDDRVSGRMEMFGGVAIRRIVATADVTACPAQPQVHPLRACFQTLFAAASTWRHFAYRCFLTAFIGHGALCRLSETLWQVIPHHFHQPRFARLV